MVFLRHVLYKAKGVRTLGCLSVRRRADLAEGSPPLAIGVRAECAHTPALFVNTFLHAATVGERSGFVLPVRGGAESARGPRVAVKPLDMSSYLQVAARIECMINGILLRNKRTVAN